MGRPRKPRILKQTAFHEHKRLRQRLVRLGFKGQAPKRIDDGFKLLSQAGKYKARGRRVDDIWFPSKAEADRYEQLKEMVKLGTIADLEVHPTYPCRVNGQLITTYISDFRYRIKPGKLGSRVLVEDVKGMRTLLYTVKKRLVMALHGLEILELPVPKRGVARYRYITADQFHTVKDPADGGAKAHDKPGPEQADD